MPLDLICTVLCAAYWGVQLSTGSDDRNCMTYRVDLHQARRDTWQQQHI